MISTIFDIEASCEDKDKNPHYNMETIEIGAVKVKDGEVIDEFQAFIKPEYITELTPYCKELTGITFEDLEDAESFNDVIVDFFKFIYKTTIYSCGEFDRKFLVRELRDKGDKDVHNLVSNAIQSSHVNLKKHYSKVTSKKRQGMVGMAKELGVELTGEHHRALDDSRNLANIFFEIEKIREEQLKRVFGERRMEEIICSLNEHHKKYFTIQKEKELYKVTKSSGSAEVFTQKELFDRVKDLVRVDHEQRYLSYLSTSELKSIEKYTI